jgi:hypothetical protein
LTLVDEVRKQEVHLVLPSGGARAYPYLHEVVRRPALGRSRRRAAVKLATPSTVTPAGIAYEPGGWKLGGVAGGPATAGRCATSSALYPNMTIDQHKAWFWWNVVARS